MLCECTATSAKLAIGKSLLGEFDVRGTHACCVRRLSGARRDRGRRGANATQHVLSLAEGLDERGLALVPLRHLATALSRRFGPAALPNLTAAAATTAGTRGTPKARLVHALLARTRHARLARFWAAASTGDRRRLLFSDGKAVVGRGAELTRRLRRPRKEELARLMIARFEQLASGAAEPDLARLPAARGRWPDHWP